MLPEDDATRAQNRYDEGDPRGGQFAPAGYTNSGSRVGPAGTAGKASSSSPSSKSKAKAEEPAAPRSSAKFRTLGPDEDNDPQAVAEMQQLLTALGLGNLTSGQYDDDTENAVKAAQRKLGIKKPNGRASKSLVGKLLNAYDLSPCIKRSDDPPPLLTIERARPDDEDTEPDGDETPPPGTRSEGDSDV